jgi:hypothetical protein
MAEKLDEVRERYRPQLQRGLGQAIAQRLGQEFPRLGGPRVLELAAQMVLEVVEAFQPPSSSLRHGQVLWNAICIDDPPARGKTAAQTRSRPVVLTLSSEEDIQGVIDRVPYWERMGRRCARLCREAHRQGALLSDVDLACLLARTYMDVCGAITRWEKEKQEVVPRRATLHDMGSGVTHKRIICLLHHVEGKAPSEVARVTYHTLRAVDNYLGMYDRVRHCRQEGMDEAKTAFLLRCSKRLVRAYLEIDAEVEARRAGRNASPAVNPDSPS